MPIAGPRTTGLSDEQLLARLIAFDSTSSRSNRPIADFVCEYVEAPGVEVVRNPSTDGEKMNVLAVKGPPAEGSRGGLILSGHLDTVPATEPEWTSDPFTLTTRDEAYYGRGTADMKGFDALAINTFREADIGSLAAPLVLLLTYDEEVGSLGARHFVASWPVDRLLPRNAIIGEPTSLGVVRMHKGHLKIRITIRGRAAHSGSPHLGVSAIEPLGSLLRSLTELRLRLEGERTPVSNFFPEVPHPVLTVGRIRAGEALNVIPDMCVVEVGIRLLPGEDSAPVVASIRDAVRMIEGAVTCDVDVVNDNPPLLTDEAAGIHESLRSMMGQEESRGVSFASDGGWLSMLGIDCVLWGPGSIEVAHKPDEHLPVGEFARARDLLRGVVREYTSERVGGYH